MNSSFRDVLRYVRWIAKGSKGSPPSIVKYILIKNCAKKSNSKILVETGTYLGDMLNFNKSNFDHLYSVELSKELFKKASIRFKNDKKISLYLGNSAKVLPRILAKIKSPPLFWLDAHYSGGITAKSDKDTPIFEELCQIFLNSKKKKFNFVILVDDVNCFNGTNSYPKLEQVISFSEKNGFHCNVENNILFIN